MNLTLIPPNQMPHKLAPLHVPIGAFLLSSGLLIGAWIFQYGLGYAPCQMCYWQRHAHKIVMGLSVIAAVIYFIRRPDMRCLNLLIALALLGSAALGAWHMGVEYKWWDGPKSCASGPIDLDAFSNGRDLLDSLNKPAKAPACSDAVWHFIGLSMAAWNMLISFVGAALAVGFGLRKNKP